MEPPLEPSVPSLALRPVASNPHRVVVREEALIRDVEDVMGCS